MSLQLGGLGTPLALTLLLSWDPTQWLVWATVWWDDVTATGWPWGTSRFDFAVQSGPNSTVGLGYCSARPKPGHFNRESPTNFSSKLEFW